MTFRHALLLLLIAAVAVATGWFAAFVLDAPLGAGSWSEELILVVAATPLVLLLLLFGLTRYGRPRGQGRSSYAMVVLLGAAVGLGGGLTTAAAWRFAVSSPPEDLLESLPLVATAGPVRGEPAGALANPNRWALLPTLVYQDALGPLMLRRACFNGLCDVRLYAPHDAALGQLSDDGHNEYRFRADQPLKLRRDEVRALWVVEAPDGAVAFTWGSLNRLPLTTRLLAATLSPPRTWIAVAALGLLLTTLLLLQRRGLSRRVAAIVAGRPALLRGGWLFFDDPQPALRWPAAAGPEGPVIVLDPSPAPTLLYRGQLERGGALGVCHGTRPELLQALGGRQQLYDAYTFAAVLLTTAPLTGAATLGLIF